MILYHNLIVEGIRRKHWEKQKRILKTNRMKINNRTKKISDIQYFRVSDIAFMKDSHIIDILFSIEKFIDVSSLRTRLW